MMIPGRIFCLILGADVLSIIPLPAYLSAMRPAWVLLLVLYLQAYFPSYFHVLGVMLLGFCLDALLSTPMGEHAFALIITTWLMVGRTRRFPFFSIMEQMLLIGLAACGYQLILYIVDASFGHNSSLYQVFGVTLTSMLCWPWIARTNVLRWSRYSHLNE